MSSKSTSLDSNCVRTLLFSILVARSKSVGHEFHRQFQQLIRNDHCHINRFFREGTSTDAENATLLVKGSEGFSRLGPMVLIQELSVQTRIHALPGSTLRKGQPPDNSVCKTQVGTKSLDCHPPTGNQMSTCVKPSLVLH
jgi:hypothetical protein